MPQKINLLHQRIGKLTVIASAENIKGRTAWLCQCDCGKQKIITTQLLRRGTVQSCGCLKSEKSNIKIGDKINKLTILEKTNKRIKGSIVWRCQCECGNIVEKTTEYLHRDIFHSCGCYSIDFISQLNKKDLTNQKFGKLTAIKPLSKRTASGCVVWQCKCDCGNEVEVGSSYLISGNTSSCGCINYSIGEKKIKTILDQNNIIYKTQWSCEQLNKKRFDFALIKDDNTVYRLIEFDGKQHYTDISGIWNSIDSLEDIQKRDQEKNEYAKEHNIPLVRIPYWERDNITLEMLLGNQYLI